MNDKIERAWFEEWRAVAEFSAAVEHSRPDDHRTNAAKFWREAWIASEFAKRTEKLNAELRLTADGCPLGDFEFRDASGTHLFEVTEALDPRVARESRTSSGLIWDSPEDVAGEMARRKISELIIQKSAKDYPANTSLIIYVNLWGPKSIDDLVPQCGHSFQSIWLLTDGRAISI